MGSKNLFRYKKFDIVQEHAAMKVGTDSDLLGTLAAGGKDILDIGTGTGIISLMMAQRFPEAKITAIDIDDNAILDATVNFANSPFADRLTLQHISFQDYLEQFQVSSSKFQNSCGNALNPAFPECEHSEQTLKLKPQYDCIVCNPPYFDKSQESDDLSRTRARHTSSLPFSVLIGGAYQLLKEGGVFSVCIPPEVLEEFSAECIFKGFWLQDKYKIKSIPEKEAKRFVLVHKKGSPSAPRIHTFCMRNSDKSRSEWYKELMKEFHL